MEKDNNKHQLKTQQAIHQTIISPPTLRQSLILFLTSLCFWKQPPISSQTKQEMKQQSKTKFYTWDEITMHDTPQSAWVVIHGKVYDLTKWVPYHPGGSVIYDAAGGDCTPFWQSYHPTYITKNGSPPKKYYIGEVLDYKPTHKWDNKFYTQLKEKVQEKIEPKNRKSHWVMYLKTLIILSLFVCFLYYYMFTHTILSAVLLGLACSQIGVNIQHDGNHIAFSSNSFLSRLAGLSLELIGGSSINFIRNHNFGHHGHVNDNDLDKAYDKTYPILRMQSKQLFESSHRFQQYYVLLVYAINNFFDLFGQIDGIQFKSNYPYRRGYSSKYLYILRAVALTSHMLETLIIPWYWYGFVSSFGLWMLFHMVFSVGYVILFAINHWTEQVLGDRADKSQNNNQQLNDWAVEQVQNSTNFATKSQFWTQISGGLNFQIEHHLFPGMIHSRLPEIRDIVIEKCKKYGVRYMEYPSFRAAVESHYQLLVNMSKPNNENDKQD